MKQKKSRNNRSLQLRRVNNIVCKDGRQAVEANGEMALYFVVNNPATLPNRKALEFHKAACLIWRMAGGVEVDDECCSDDDDFIPVPVSYTQKPIREWLESCDTLTDERIY
jgi:hypothetical protein